MFKIDLTQYLKTHASFVQIKSIFCKVTINILPEVVKCIQNYCKHFNTLKNFWWPAAIFKYASFMRILKQSDTIWLIKHNTHFWILKKEFLFKFCDKNNEIIHMWWFQQIFTFSFIFQDDAKFSQTHKRFFMHYFVFTFPVDQSVITTNYQN